jgi:hypothetical protein
MNMNDLGMLIKDVGLPAFCVLFVLIRLDKRLIGIESALKQFKCKYKEGDK